MILKKIGFPFLNLKKLINKKMVMVAIKKVKRKFEGGMGVIVISSSVKYLFILKAAEIPKIKVKENKTNSQNNIFKGWGKGFVFISSLFSIFEGG